MADERTRADTDELANPQPELARRENSGARRSSGSSVYEPGDAVPPENVDDAEDAGQQVIGESRERAANDG